MTLSTTRIAIVVLAFGAAACGDDGTGTGGGDSTSVGTGEPSTGTGDTSGQPTGGSASGGGSPSSSSTEASSSGEGAGGSGSGTAGGGSTGAGGDEPGTCTDEARNNNESDVDCGGPCAGCAAGFACVVDADCASGASCEGDVCAVDPVGVWTNSVTLGTPPLAEGSGVRGAQLFYDSELERTVLYGGFWGAPDVVYDFTLLYDGESWTDADAGGDAPPPRGGGSAAYMRDRGAGIVYGGGTFSESWEDTWEWTSSTQSWTQVDDGEGTGPGVRGGHTLTYDAQRHVVVLFGGFVGSTPQNDVWEWDDGWTKITPDNAPPPARGSHGAAYVDSIGMVVVFGGETANGQRIGDTWGWDGTAWAKLADITDAGPGALTLIAAFAQDTFRDRAVLFGGNLLDVNSSPDTWEFDGDRWRRIAIPLGTIGGAYSSAMVYDQARARMVLLRGSGPPIVHELHMLGNVCGDADECGGGFCTDGVCCETACASGDCATLEEPGFCR